MYANQNPIIKGVRIFIIVDRISHTSLRLSLRKSKNTVKAIAISIVFIDIIFFIVSLLKIKTFEMYQVNHPILQPLLVFQ